MKTTKYKKAGVKKQTGGVPAQSFVEPPMERPFDSKNEFVAQSGGERMKTLKKDQKEVRKTARKDRRADRKADREAVRTLKKSSRKTRRAKPFVDGAGPIVEMSRGEKREDRKATNKAARSFKKQERKARRTSRKDLKAGQKSARQEQRGQNKISREEQKNKKLNTLNNSESSSVKPVIKKKESTAADTGKKIGKVVKEIAKTDKKATVVKKESTKKKSYSQAYKDRSDTYKNMNEAEYTKEAKRQNEVYKKTGKWDVKKSYPNTVKKKEEKKTTTKKKSSGSNYHKEAVLTGYYACFSEGTLIETSNGQIPIEMINIDDEVKSYNTKTKEIELAKVDELFVHEDCSDGLLLNGIIKTTTNHPFYVDGKWVEAGDLKIGDKILHVDGLTHEITSMEINTDKQTVYNFEVPGHHNYFAEGYLVHNKRKTGGYRRKGGVR